MSAKISSEEVMAASAYLDEAARWSKDITRMRARGPGDIVNAMRSVERDYGVDYWTMWRLRYRRASLRDIGVGVYMGLKAAYQAECERQLRKLECEIKITAALAASSSGVVGKAKALVVEAGELNAGNNLLRRGKKRRR